MTHLCSRTYHGYSEGKTEKKECRYCGLDNSRDQMVRDEEGYRFCDDDCRKFFREEVTDQ